MNICMITSTLPPVTGGLETHVWGLSRALKRKGHNVTLIGYRNYQGKIFPAYEKKDGINIYREWDSVLPIYYFRYNLFCLRAAARVCKIHKKHHFDLVHAHQVYPAGIAGTILQRLWKISLVITCHGTALFLNWEVEWIRPLMRWAMKRADQMIGGSPELRDKIIACGISPRKVVYLPNSVNIQKFSPGENGRDIRREYNCKPGHTVIGFLGRLHPVKGPQYFLRAALELSEEHPNLKFLLIGSGELESQLQEQTRLSGKEKAFVFAGEVRHQRVPELLGAIDILVIPSLAESTGISCLEGMAMGKAIVANRVGGIPELLIHGQSGLLVNLKSSRSIHYDYGLGNSYIRELKMAVKRLISDQPLRERLGKKARAEAETHYSWEAYLRKLRPLYLKAASLL